MPSMWGWTGSKKTSSKMFSLLDKSDHDKIRNFTSDEQEKLLPDFSKNHFRDPKQKSEDLLQMVADFL
ncbi:hypothetical protein D3C76_1661930 [compost metagenome]